MLRLVLILALLSACGRPLSPAERRFAANLQGPGLDTARVRVVDGALVGNVVHWRPARPQKACRERIHPPETAAWVPTSTAAFVLFEKVFVARRLYRDDYLAGYPDRLPLTRAMLLGHELTHVWQWQNRAVTGYSPLKAAAEHAPKSDPYLFELGGDRDFLDYSYEQQGGIVEEYICCAALDPEGTRTRRLERMLGRVFPGLAERAPARARDVALPWDGAKTAGICS